MGLELKLQGLKTNVEDEENFILTDISPGKRLLRANKYVDALS